MGATLAGLRAVAVPPARADGSGLDLGAIDAADVERGALALGQLAGQPLGGAHGPRRGGRLGRAHGVPVFSDECYTEFTWLGPPRSILQHGVDRVVAVHSLSKRSNLAGVRAGFFAGDPELVDYLRRVRQHAGLMVAGTGPGRGRRRLCRRRCTSPTSATRYAERLSFMATRLSASGCPVALPEGAFYLWVPVPDAWGDALGHGRRPRATAGMLVSPGELYGPPGLRFVRVAMVQPMVRLRLVAERLAAAGWTAAG